jgi:hypothetical protein
MGYLLYEKVNRGLLKLFAVERGGFSAARSRGLRAVMQFTIGLLTRGIPSEQTNQSIFIPEGQRLATKRRPRMRARLLALICIASRAKPTEA